MNLSIEYNDDTLNEYAKIICEKAINNHITVEEALIKLYSVSEASEYDSKYIRFYEIQEDLDQLEYGDVLIFNSLSNRDNFSQYILEEINFFLKSEEFGIPIIDRSLYFCETCMNLNTPIWIEKFHLLKFKENFHYFMFKMYIT